MRSILYQIDARRINVFTLYLLYGYISAGCNQVKKKTIHLSGLVALLITKKFEEPLPGNEGDMTQVEQLAAFVVHMTYEDLSEEARRQLKIRILDALGCAIGAL